MWAQTQDAPLDEYLYLQHRYAMKKDKDGNKSPKWTWYAINLPYIGNYLARVFWLVRNPAYGLSEALGFPQEGLTIYKDTTLLGSNWRKPWSGYDLQLATNKEGQKGFLFQGQWVYSKSRKMEYRLGYGLTRKSPLRGKGMIYARILPFKKV